MTIKDKLIELQVDIEKNKALVDDVKKALTDAGENATKIAEKAEIVAGELYIRRHGRRFYDNSKSVL